MVTSGIRLGTPIVTRNGMGPKEMESISALMDSVLKGVEIVSDSEYTIDNSFKEQTQLKVKDLCSRFGMR
jgi:glycine/serine hydroxymethyltransferase